MNFASLLALISLVSSAMAVYVTSADGTKIWAESTGNPSKPAVVFIPGFSCSSLAFDKQWTNSFMKANLFMARNIHLSLSPSIMRLVTVESSFSARSSDVFLYFRYNRSDTTSVVRELATNHWSRLPMGPSNTLRISRPSLTTSKLGRRSQSWLDGAFGRQRSSSWISLNRFPQVYGRCHRR